MNNNPYKSLATRLDQLPNGYPATADGAELRLLEAIYTPEEAALAAELRLTLETASEIAARLPTGVGVDPGSLKKLLKDMARKGLIATGKTERGIGFGLMPFVVGIYEMQINRMDIELARLFEEYYLQAFGELMQVQPSFHRVVPIHETIQADIQILPYESATEIINQAKSWGVFDCICRTQKALLGKPCQHPVETCMVNSPVPGSFDHSTTIRALTRKQAIENLHMAARAGLVHTVSNSKHGNHYICNCCTCSCGLLRGMADLGIANVVARSAFVNRVDPDLCMACETCVDYCQFQALVLFEGLMGVDEIRCVGCGICVQACPEGALSLIRRPEQELPAIPEDEHAWRLERAKARGIDMGKVL